MENEILEMIKEKIDFRINESDIKLLHTIFDGFSKCSNCDFYKIGELLFELSNRFDDNGNAKRFYSWIIFNRLILNRSVLNKSIRINKNYALYNYFNIFERIILKVFF